MNVQKSQVILLCSQGEDHCVVQTMTVDSSCLYVSFTVIFYLKHGK